jgi:hypothetical protein
MLRADVEETMARELETPRASHRHQLRFKLVYDDGASYSAGYVEDISEGGLFVESAHRVPEGAVVRLETTESGADVLVGLRARVVRVVALDPFAVNPVHQDGAFGLGLELLDLSANDRSALSAMIVELGARRRLRACRDPFLAIRVPGAPPRAA